MLACSRDLGIASIHRLHRRHHVVLPAHEMKIVVVLPVSPKDAGLAVKWLRWQRVLHPSSGAAAPQIMVFFARELTVTQKQLLDHVCGDQGIFPLQCQVGTEFPSQGYGVAANTMFVEALTTAEAWFPGHAVLWCEADTVPMRTGWSDEIAAEYAACGKPFLGDFHADGGIAHMTGVAVYPHNWSELAPCLAALPGKDPECGWDTQCAYETVPKMARSKTIQQIWRPAKFTKENRELVRAQTALFHQCKDGSLIDVLCDEQKIPRIPLIQEPQEKEATALAVPQISIMNTEIFIVSFKRDMEFLRFCLLSIAKYARGFAGTTLVVPKSEEGLYDWAFGLLAIQIKYFDQIPGKEFLGHLIQKCKADEYCPYAQVVVHLDADTMFWSNAVPSDFAPNARPIVVREAYDVCGKLNPNRLYWQTAVEKVIGIKPEFDFMVRHPQVHVRDTYAETRAAIEKHTRQKFEDYIYGCQNDFPQTFCEFNTLTTVAMALYPERYTVKDYNRAANARAAGVKESDAWQYVYQNPGDKICEFWSHSGIAPYTKIMRNIMAGNPPSIQIK